MRTPVLVWVCFCYANHARRVQIPFRGMQGDSLAQDRNVQVDDIMSSYHSWAELKHSHSNGQEGFASELRTLAAVLLGIVKPAAGWQATASSYNRAAHSPRHNRAVFPLVMSTPVAEPPTAPATQLQTGKVKSYDGARGEGFIACSAVDGDVLFLQRDLPVEIRLTPQSKQPAMLVDKIVTFNLEVSPTGEAQALKLQVREDGFDYEQALMVYSGMVSEQSQKRQRRSASSQRDRLQMVCSAIRSGEWAIVNATLDTPMNWTVGAWRGMLNAAWQTNDCNGALQLLERMENSGLTNDVAAYGYAISACCNNKANQPQMASVLLQRLENSGAEVPERTYSTVAAAWAKSTQWRAASYLLKATPRKARKLWQCNAVLSSCAVASRWSEALDVLHDMEAYGPAPNAQSYLAVASACLKMNKTESANEVKKRMYASVKEGTNASVLPDESSVFSYADSSVFDYTQMLKSLTKAGEWNEAVKMYDNMPSDMERTDLVLDAGVEAASAGKDWKAATRMIREAMDKETLPRLSTFNMAFNALAAANRPAVLLRLFRRMQSAGVRPNFLTYNAVVKAFKQEGRWQQAVRMLQEMLRANLKPSLIIYNWALGACVVGAKQEMLKSGVGVSQPMLSAAALAPAQNSSIDGDAAITDDPYAEVPPDDERVGVALRECSTVGEQAMELLVDLQGRGLKPDVVTYSSVISVLSTRGEFERILGLIGAMERAKVEANEFSWAAAIAACERADQPKLALGLFSGLREVAEDIDAPVWTAAISAAGSDGDVEMASKLMEEMRAEGLNVTLGAYNGVLRACDRAADGTQAINVLGMMKADGLEPNKISYTLVLSALGRARLWMPALGVWQQMLLEGVDFDGKTFGTLLRVLTYCGEWERSLDCFERARVLTPTICKEIVYAAALEACAAGAQGDHALDLLREMGREKLVPSAACFHGVCAACAAAGDWKSSLSAFQDMLRQEMQPLPQTWELVFDACSAAGQEEEASLLGGLAERLGVPLVSTSRSVAWTDFLTQEI